MSLVLPSYVTFHENIFHLTWSQILQNGSIKLSYSLLGMVHDDIIIFIILAKALESNS